MLKRTQTHVTKGRINRIKIYGKSQIKEESINLKQMENVGVFGKVLPHSLGLFSFPGHLILSAFGVRIIKQTHSFFTQYSHNSTMEHRGIPVFSHF